MTTIDLERPLETSRAKRLRAATHEAHEGLDKRIMQSDPFVSRERYGLFVMVQHQFHREIDALYSNSVLDKLLPDLGRRRRFNLIEQDLADLDIAPPATDVPPVFMAGADVDIPATLGWLYVAEGSNLGAALLLKEALRLGLSESYGARHLASAPEGRGLHWKTFTAALDAVRLPADEDQRVIAGANEAFVRVRALVDGFLPSNPKDVMPLGPQSRLEQAP